MSDTDDAIAELDRLNQAPGSERGEAWEEQVRAAMFRADGYERRTAELYATLRIWPD